MVSGSGTDSELNSTGKYKGWTSTSPLLLFSWPPVREVCPNYEMVILQPWTGNPPDLGSVANYNVYILLITTLLFPALHPMSSRGGIPARVPYLSPFPTTVSPQSIILSPGLHLSPSQNTEAHISLHQNPIPPFLPRPLHSFRIPNVAPKITIINGIMINYPHDIWNHRSGVGRRGTEFEVRCWIPVIELCENILPYINEGLTSIHLTHFYPQITHIAPPFLLLQQSQWYKNLCITYKLRRNFPKWRSYYWFVTWFENPYLASCRLVVTIVVSHIHRTHNCRWRIHREFNYVFIGPLHFRLWLTWHITIGTTSPQLAGDDFLTQVTNR